MPSHAGDHDLEHREAPVRDLEAGEQHDRLARGRDAGAVEQHQDEDPGQAEVADHVRREVDDRLGERGCVEQGGQGKRAATRPCPAEGQGSVHGRGDPSVRHRGAASRGARRSSSRAIAARGRLRPLHPRARGRGVRARVRRLPRRASTSSGVANGTDAITIALRALGRRAGRRRGRARPSPSTRAPRRSRTPARGRCSATSIPRRSASRRRRSSGRSRRPRRRSIAVHLFGRAGAGRRAARAARAAAASRCSRTPRRRPARALGGRRAGSLGDVATFSFFPSKNLFCLGDGGAIATDDDGARRARADCCASTARATRATFTEVGWNSRLDALQAAVLRVTLARLDDWNAAPPRAGRRLRGGGARRAGRRCRDPPTDEEPVHHLYVVARRATRRARRGGWPRRASPRGSYYRVPVHRQPAMAAWRAGARAARAPMQAARDEPRAADGPDARPGHRAPGGRGAAPSRARHGLAANTAFTRAGAPRGRCVSP